MDTSVISALAALAGTAVGGLTSVLANLLTHRIQVAPNGCSTIRTAGRVLYRDFIEEVSMRYIDALQHDEADIPGLVGFLCAKLQQDACLVLQARSG